LASIGRLLSRDFRLGLRPQRCHVLTLRLPVLALLGREELLVFLLEQLADALVDSTFVLPATRLLVLTASLPAPAPEHDGRGDEPACRQEAEHPGNESGVRVLHDVLF
jgi:hypothetical protein